MTENIEGTAFLIGLFILVALIIWAINWITTDPKWSPWMPTIYDGKPGFSRFKLEEGISDDMMRSDPHSLIRRDQFFPLDQFFGKGFKPVPLEKWQKLYTKGKPYKWHATSEMLKQQQRKQLKKSQPKSI